MTISPDLAARIVGVAAAIGVLIPLVQAVLQKPWWSPRAKAILTVALAVVGGIAGYITQNGVDLTDPVKIALWVAGGYAAATTLYARLLRPLGVTGYLEHNVNGPTRIVDGPDPHDGHGEDPADPAADSDGGDVVDVDGDGRDDTTGRFVPRG